LYLFTERRAKKSVINPHDFRELLQIQKNWETIREEAIGLYKQKHFESVNDPDSPAYYDVGFRTFFKYGWSKFYINWYGNTHESAKMLCPNTVKILEQIPSVNGAMFSLLPPGSQLTRHADPLACSIRYHLGLSTPNSENCFINVDGQSYAWKDGEAFLFDETYLHFVKNNSDQYRLILMCDIERPMSVIGHFVNLFYKQFVRLTLVPNTEQDKRGLFSILFSSIAPILGKAKKLRASNIKLYLLLKYTVNLTLVMIAVVLATALLQAMLWIFSALT
jgi:beta-hydroxylase